MESIKSFKNPAYHWAGLFYHMRETGYDAKASFATSAPSLATIRAARVGDFYSLHQRILFLQQTSPRPAWASPAPVYPIPWQESLAPLPQLSKQ